MAKKQSAPGVKKATGKEKSTAQKAVATDAPPVCVAMLVCENAIIGNDNVISAIRIIDTISIPPSEQLVEGENLGIAGLKLLVMFKNGDATGEVPCLMLSTGPSGKREPIGLIPYVVEGNPEGGNNLITAVVVHWEGEGLYWLEMQANERTLVKTPITIRVNQPAAAPKSADALREKQRG